MECCNSEFDGYLCTLEKGHKHNGMPEHVAHGLNGEVFKRWVHGDVVRPVELTKQQQDLVDYLFEMGASDDHIKCLETSMFEEDVHGVWHELYTAALRHLDTAKIRGEWLRAMAISFGEWASSIDDEA